MRLGPIYITMRLCASACVCVCVHSGVKLLPHCLRQKGEKDTQEAATLLSAVASPARFSPTSSPSSASFALSGHNKTSRSLQYVSQWH